LTEASALQPPSTSALAAALSVKDRA